MSVLLLVLTACTTPSAESSRSAASAIPCEPLGDGLDTGAPAASSTAAGDTATRAVGLGLCVEQDPAAPLVIRVKWSTDEPGTSEVTFSEPGGPSWRIANPGLTREHAVALYGLHPETEVSFDVLSVLEGGGEVRVEGLTARTGSVPEWVPEAEVLVHDPERVQPGWTLLNLSNRDADWPPTSVAYDADGLPVWFRVTDTNEDHRGDLDVSLTPDGHVLVGGSGADIRALEVAWDGSVVWVGPEQEPLVHHHHVEKLADGTYVMLRHVRDGGGDALLDRIVRYDLEHRVVWDWDPFDHLALPDPVPNDWLHANAVTVTEERVWLSCRNLDQILGIEPESGDVVEVIGRGGDHTLAGGRWFAGQHDPELQPDGSWLLYDNQGLSGRHSRVMRLTAAEGAAEVVWEFPGGVAQPDPWYAEAWYSSIWGDADALPNGNVLVAAGTREEGRESRVFEVDPLTNDVVWSIRWSESPGIVGVYRAERIAVPLERAR